MSGWWQSGLEELACEQLWLEDSEWPSCEILLLFSTRGAGGEWRSEREHSGRALRRATSLGGVWGRSIVSRMEVMKVQTHGTEPQGASWE